MKWLMRIGLALTIPATANNIAWEEDNRIVIKMAQPWEDFT